MWGLDGTLKGLIPVFKETWAAGFDFSCLALKNQSIVTCCIAQIGILDLLLQLIASTHYLNKMKTDGRFNMPVETVRLIFMMAFGEPQDLKWVSVSVGFRVNYFCRSKVFRSPSVCLSSAVHLWYIIFDLDKYRSAKFLLAIASNALLVHFCPLFHSA